MMLYYTTKLPSQDYLVNPFRQSNLLTLFYRDDSIQDAGHFATSCSHLRHPRQHFSRRGRA